MEILIEMHGRFNPITAIEMSMALAAYKPSWVEEPVPPAIMLALQKVTDAVRRWACRWPPASGCTMHEYRELFELHAADIIQPDIAHFGGILNTKKLAAWADIYYAGSRRTTSAARSPRRQRCTWRPPRRISRSGELQRF